MKWNREKQNDIKVDADAMIGIMKYILAFKEEGYMPDEWIETAERIVLFCEGRKERRL